MIDPRELETANYELLARMHHASLGEFAIEYFIRRTSWLTWVHHLMSLAVVGAIVITAMQQHRSALRCVCDLALAFACLVVVILPIHELLHALAYKVVGATDIRWDYSLRMAAVWVIAHRFVATAGPFVAVALAPFVVINAALLFAAVAFPQAAVFLLCVLLWHLHGAIGDWALLNFIWLHRDRGFWTYDDAESGTSFFFGRSA